MLTRDTAQMLPPLPVGPLADPGVACLAFGAEGNALVTVNPLYQKRKRRRTVAQKEKKRYREFFVLTCGYTDTVHMDTRLLSWGRVPGVRC